MSLKPFFWDYNITDIVHLGAVLAHELCHAYFTLNFYGDDLVDKICEGTCELWGYVYLMAQEKESVEAKYRMKVMRENTDKIYGDGFRLALEAYEKNPDLLNLMKFIKKQKKFPTKKGEVAIGA